MWPHEFAESMNSLLKKNIEPWDPINTKSATLPDACTNYPKVFFLR
jgi:hypothetical protein